MASNFRVFIHRNGDNIHLKLSGGFDGSSAHELLNILALHGGKAKKIFIHTSGLSAVHSFGKDVFHGTCSRHKRLVRNMIFTGEAGRELAVEGSRHMP